MLNRSNAVRRPRVQPPPPSPPPPGPEYAFAGTISLEEAQRRRDIIYRPLYLIQNQNRRKRVLGKSL